MTRRVSSSSTAPRSPATGYTVETTATIEGARERLAQGGIDLVVLDIRLGEASGLALLREIKAQDAHLPVVLATAYARYQDDFSSWLADAYIVKSSDLNELKQAVRRCLGERPMIPVVMAGGFGTRIRPLSANRPKPMLPIVNRPILERVLTHLASFGMREAVLLTYYDPDKIRAAFGDGKRLGMKLHYNNADQDYGTAGAVAHGADLVAAEDYLVLSGDVICDFDLSSLIAAHRQRQAMVTIGLTRVANPLQFGIVIIDGDSAGPPLPRKADVGRGLLRHREHGHLRSPGAGARAGPPQRAVRLLARPLSPPARERRSPRSATSCAATGATSATRSRTSQRTSTTSRAPSASCRPASCARSAASLCGSKGKRRSTPRSRFAGRSWSAPAAGSAPMSVSRTRCSAPARSFPRGPSCAGRCSGKASRSARAPGSRRPSSAPAFRSAIGTVVEKGAVIADDTVLGAGGAGQGRREDLAGQGGRGSRRRLLEPGVRRTVAHLRLRGGRGHRPHQPRAHARGGRPAGRGLRHSAPAGEHDPHRPRRPPGFAHAAPRVRRAG